MLGIEGQQGCRPGGPRPGALRGAHSGWRGSPTMRSLISGSGQVLSGDTCYRGGDGAPQLRLPRTALGPGSSSGCRDCSSLGVPPAAVAMPGLGAPGSSASAFLCLCLPLVSGVGSGLEEEQTPTGVMEKRVKTGRAARMDCIR